MSTAQIKALLDKLNEHCLQALESAAAFAGMRGHFEVCIEHLVVKLLEKGEGDFDLILRHFDVNLDRLWQAMLDNLSRLRSGNRNKPSFSLQLLEWFERAWTISSLRDPQAQLRSGALLEALLDLAPRLPGTAWLSLEVVSRNLLQSHLAELIRFSVENPQLPSAAEAVVPSPATASVRSADTATPHLDAYTTDFTARAAKGAIDPVLGRNDEIRQIIDILTRRRKNNPILVGEPGVGKTAVVEGLALRIAENGVPDSLKKVRLVGLDLGLLQAGAGVKGEFEKRLKSVIEEIISSPTPIILFIDEAHTLIGAGGDAGQGDAANLLKPALARGELRTLAATTWSEYKKYFERDAALERRFQMVKVEEPSQDNAIVMLNGLKGHYQKHHGVLITDSAVEAAVSLSSRYINGRYLPDKAIDLLDTAAARICMGKAATPAEVDTAREHLTYIERRRKHLAEETAQGIPADVNLLADLQQQEEEARKQLTELEQRWQAERALVGRIQESRTGGKDALADLATLQRDLQELQKNSPLVQPEVDADTIARVVADWTGVPVGRMVKNDLANLLDFENTLSRRIIGQESAIHAIGQSIRCSKAGLRENQAPIGVFLLTGPSGVGKTETARAIADTLYGGERFMVTINMSEYQEAHSVSQLKGSPPGYVGYGEGGILTEAVRQRPYSVILLDEVEKAHPDVLNMFYQVFDRGFMRDGEGREIDFKNTVLIMTSNLGAETILDLCAPPEPVGEEEEPETPFAPPSHGALIEAARPALTAHFPAALLARMQIVPLRPLDRDTLRQIIAQKLDKVAQRLFDAHGIRMRCTPEVIDHLVGRCHTPESGARAVNTLIEQNLLPGISRSLLGFMVNEDMPQLMALEVGENGELECLFSDIVKEDEPQFAQAGAGG
ncbi:type VI secretion system ATPase TssH, putative chaperone [Syntrophotalea carbinolica DSM 2380]|uniref:Type VI secretion system ATPase TssH, putative chaperone n=1 Tax=Syntrophotalea carbinolica (strain DSM 2380 / NBRC 103641 / GraBd1) TaxID=338963 RepID=Q3A0Q2_SYNC1|nr:type VI secretion system ATPase TssH [Syntrophotalea carbinolica]ABA90055.1 type VI secretion system ATPase TssH, putative chaperone [Syntrophotalea carbinolica DSM 2380]